MTNLPQFDCTQCYDGHTKVEGRVVVCENWTADDWEICPKRRKEWNSLLQRAGVFERYRGARFNKLTPRPGQDSRAFEQVRLYAREGRFKEGVGLILKGPVGTGKTTVAVAVLQEALSRNFGGLFLVTASLLDNLFTLKAKNLEEWVAYENALKSAGLLVLDDFGYEHTEGWVLTKLDAIISERYNRCKPVVITTNLSSRQMQGKYSEHILDRLRETSEVINFRGESLRRPPERVEETA